MLAIMDADADEIRPNAAEWSVTELSGALRRTVEDAFGFVRVRGEITGYRGPHSSGHVYFALKDQGARIEAVIWKGVFARLKMRPEEGMEIIATGKVTTFPGQSKYQIVIDAMEPAGIGALMALLEERKRRLAAEGLFDPARKQLIPLIPEVIGVITSPTGAVIRDILHRLADRFPRRVIVWPVRVQGETSPAEVAAAIRGFNALPAGSPIPRPDVIIVARGGGSIEDLLGFSDEAVVRAAADSDIPIVSAVGHETDTTLIDYAADVRAPTPTAAAELVVPVRSELLAQVADLAGRQRTAARRSVERRRIEYRATARALPGRDALLSTPRQKLDLAAERLSSLRDRLAARQRRTLQDLVARLLRRSPQAVLAARSARLDALGESLARQIAQRRSVAADRLRETDARLRRSFTAHLRSHAAALTHRRQRLDAASARLEPALARVTARRRDRLNALWSLAGSYSHTGVLARGFALLTAPDGALVRSAAQLEPDARFTVRLADGAVDARALGPGAPSPQQDSAPLRPKPRPRATPTAAPQRSLFE